jgi:hypothetical protein
MGTNYYLRQPKGEACPHCGRFDEGEKLHIGKSSFGWCFALHVIPSEGLNDLDDWRMRWRSGVIENEYGERLMPEAMDAVITKRGNGKYCHDGHWDAKSWLGYRDEDHFHASNHSERGPKGLLRHKIGRYCVKHGEGTWDCLPGEFS